MPEQKWGWYKCSSGLDCIETVSEGLKIDAGKLFHIRLLLFGTGKELRVFVN